MAQPYVGEIRMFAGNFAPAGWLFCSGQLIAISENETLFQLIGTTYGGDGQSNFALPNLQSRIPIHQGNGMILAQNGGAEEVTLIVNQMPSHGHPMLASTQNATDGRPPGNVTASNVPIDIYRESPNPNSMQNMLPGVVGSVGGSQPHSNCQPFLCINFIISLFGIFPSPT